MGSLPPERAAGVSIQRLSRQVHVAVTETLRALDKAKAVEWANQDEVESLRSVVWSDLTGLEAEFGREDGPRAELLNRFFTHLLSSGDHIGQIEALAEALLGGAPPPSQPPPDSPVAGLFRLHSALTSIRSQWQEIASATPAAAVPPAEPLIHPAPTPARAPAPSAQREAAATATTAFFDEMGVKPPKPEASVPPSVRGRASAERPRSPGSDRFFDEMGISSPSAPSRLPDGETPRPRVVVSFVVVFVILALMGVGVIWLGLNGGSPDPVGIVPTEIPTFSTALPSTTPLPTATPNPAPPKLQVTGNPLIVPCPGKGTTGFVLTNIGGQTLIWDAKVNRAGGSSQPVTLSVTHGSLSGPPSGGKDTVTVTVTASVARVNGTITITTNINDTETITYHVLSC